MMPWNNVLVQLVDAPAFSRDTMEPWMVNNIRYADAVLIVVDICGEDPADHVRGIIERAGESKILLAAGDPAAEEDEEEEALVFDQRSISKRTVIAANKMDLPDSAFWLEAFREERRDDLPVYPVSAETGEGIEGLRGALFDMLKVIRVYTRAPGRKENRDDPFIIARGSTVLDLARQIHQDLEREMKAARVWGSARFDGQAVEKTHVLDDEDVVELRT
jgi:ribosome-interacting GTPase 1